MIYSSPGARARMDAGAWVRTLHLAAMAVMAGGSALCLWALARRAPGASALLAGYEWLFWGALGASVASGVGNVGSMAAALPDAGSRWGAAFAAKILIALAALPVSLLRTLVAWGRVGPDPTGPPADTRADADAAAAPLPPVAEAPGPSGRARGALLVLHALTLAGALAAVALAEVMAHGG